MRIQLSSCVLADNAELWRISHKSVNRTPWERGKWRWGELGTDNPQSGGSADKPPLAEAAIVDACIAARESSERCQAVFNN